jgi:hypothetical protein
VDIELGAAAFWISVAAVLIAAGYFKVRGEARKQETLLRLVERTGQLDEAQVKLLFPQPLPPVPGAPHQVPNTWGTRPGEGRLTWVVIAAIVGSIGVGLLVLFTILFNFGTEPQRQDAIPGFGAAALVTCVAIGFFIASRFCSPAPSERDGGQAR